MSWAVWEAFQTRIVGDHHFKPLDNPFTKVVYDMKKVYERNSNYRFEDEQLNEMSAEIISMAAYLSHKRNAIEKLALSFIVEFFANYCASVLSPERNPSYVDSRIIFDYLLARTPPISGFFVKISNYLIYILFGLDRNNFGFQLQESSVGSHYGN